MSISVRSRFRVLLLAAVFGLSLFSGSAQPFAWASSAPDEKTDAEKTMLPFTSVMKTEPRDAMILPGGEEWKTDCPAAVLALRLPSILKTSEILVGLGESFFPRSADWIVLGTVALTLHPAFSDFDMTAPFSFFLLPLPSGGRLPTTVEKDAAADGTSPFFPPPLPRQQSENTDRKEQNAPRNEEWGLCIFADRKRETLPSGIAFGGKNLYPLFLPGKGKRVCLVSSMCLAPLISPSGNADCSKLFPEPLSPIPPGGVGLRFDRQRSAGKMLSWNDCLSHLLHFLFSKEKKLSTGSEKKRVPHAAPFPSGEKRADRRHLLLLPEEAETFLNRFDMLEWNFLPDADALSMTLLCRNSASSSPPSSSSSSSAVSSRSASEGGKSEGGESVGGAVLSFSLPSCSEFAAVLFPGRDRDALLEQAFRTFAALRKTGKEDGKESDSASGLSSAFISFLFHLTPPDREILAFAGREQGSFVFGLELPCPDVRPGELDSFLLRSGARRTEEPYFWRLREFGGELPGILYCLSEPGTGKILFLRTALPLAQLASLTVKSSGTTSGTSGMIEIPREGILRVFALSGKKAEDPPLLSVDSDGSGNEYEIRFRLEKRWMPFWSSLFRSSGATSAPFSLKHFSRESIHTPFMKIREEKTDGAGENRK